MWINAGLFQVGWLVCVLQRDFLAVLVTGLLLLTTWQGDGRVTLNHSTPTGQAKQDTLTVPPPVVADAGFNTFISDHLASLAQGQTLHFNFLNPARIDYAYAQTPATAFSHSAEPLQYTQCKSEG